LAILIHQNKRTARHALLGQKLTYKQTRRAVIKEKRLQKQCSCNKLQTVKTRDGKIKQKWQQCFSSMLTGTDYLREIDNYRSYASSKTKNSACSCNKNRLKYDILQ